MCEVGGDVVVCLFMLMGYSLGVVGVVFVVV